MSEPLARPFRPFDFAAGAVKDFQLGRIIDSLRLESAYRNDGCTAVTVARSDELTIVLTVIQKGSQVSEHKAPAPASVIVLDGKLSFSKHDGSTFELSSNDAVVFASDVLHMVKALEDCAFLIVIGGRVD